MDPLVKNIYLSMLENGWNLVFWDLTIERVFWDLTIERVRQIISKMEVDLINERFSKRCIYNNVELPAFLSYQ